MITPGNHKVSMKIMGMQTPNYKVKWIEPVDWRKGNLKSRKKELDQLAAVLVDGLPQTCVEYWLTVKDGGQQDEDKVRYFLEPNFKMTVPYRKMYASTGLHSVVDDKVKVYEENKIHD